MGSFIRNPERLKQTVDFYNLAIGKMHPTDIDLMYEIKNKAYCVIEFKYGEAPMSLGQRITLERLYNDLSKTGKRVNVLVAQHEVSNCKEDVDAATCEVRCFFNGKKWVKPHNKVTVKQCIDELLDNLP